MKQSALVTGAGGAIGGTLVRRLVEQGYTVRALLHSAKTGTSPPDNVEVVYGDITDCSLVSEAVRDMDLVFHLAAKLHIENPPAELADEYVRVNVNGTRCVVEAASAANVKRLIFFSTINVYGASTPHQIFFEDSPLHPDSLYAKTKVKAEEIVRTLPVSVVLRAAAVYGPLMKGNFPRLVRAIKKGWPVLVGDGLNRRSLIYVEDLCRAAILAAEHPLAAGQTFNVTDGSAHRLREVINAISDGLGRPHSKFRLPEFVVRAGAGVIEQSFGVVGKRAPISRATIDKLTEDMAVSGAKIQNQLGFQPSYKLIDGWRETIRLIDFSG
jgi:UDP-glucose 4-epimerase